ncbi:tyrosine-protein phosphatase [Rhizohabitans arisaemae]|uniref:tyrosine-protein phosphatase n=1 Tax=Rhizohabitans arisaemae TaxID=2720610 RepID=UPI0031FF3D5B
MTLWINLDGAVNVRDLGGLAVQGGGTTRPGRILRSDNLQALSDRDVHHLVTELKLRHVVDLRSHAEVMLEGPGPLTRVPEVTIHHHTVFAEGGARTDVEADLAVDVDAVLPWVGQAENGPVVSRTVGHYLGYLEARPDSVVSSLRVLSGGDGTALVHCAAGKDRTGVVVALALEVAGVERAQVVADYTRTGDRLEQVIGRLRASSTYAADLDSRPADSHLPRAQIMEGFLGSLDRRYGGVAGWLDANGWTEADTELLRARLCD